MELAEEYLSDLSHVLHELDPEVRRLKIESLEEQRDKLVIQGLKHMQESLKSGEEIVIIHVDTPYWGQEYEVALTNQGITRRKIKDTCGRLYMIDKEPNLFDIEHYVKRGCYRIQHLAEGPQVLGKVIQMFRNNEELPLYKKILTWDPELEK